MMATPRTKRERLNILREELLNERASFEPSWRECGQFILPHRPRFDISDANRGDRKNQSIIDSTATDAADVLQAGMMAGITSPARPWFNVTTADPDLAEFGAVKDYLYVVTKRMRNMLLGSNIYNTLPNTYSDIGAFGTSSFLAEENFDKVLHFQSFPIGSYALGKNYLGQIDTFFREFRMTVRQLISMFGRKDDAGKPDWSVFSEQVKNLWENAQYQKFIDVCHVVQPNPDHNPNRPQAKYKRFESCYWEKGSSSAKGGYLGASDENRYLRESGYDIFPVLCGRWKVTAEDVYATEWPGLTALGDIKQLQLGERRGMEAIEKMVRPPMVGPPELQRQTSNLFPGGYTYLSEREGMKGFRQAYEVRFDIDRLELKQEACRFRIKRAFKADMFLQISNANDRQRTATEIEERREEKLLVIGPVLEQLNQDVYDPLIDIVYATMNKQRRLPPPPKELQGQELKVDYVSIMHAAQKSVSVSVLERFATGVTRVAAETQNPTLLDKFDSDQWVDEYGDALGVSPRTVRSDEKVQAMREGRAETQKAQQQAELAQQAAGAAKDLSQADTSGKNALTDLLRRANAGNPLQGIA